ncbi:MAG: O-antigen ligase family protein [Victivallaceae bacterium]|nr:O-antigen ligase family protein [Victivallaceae bacterium]
MDTGKINNLNTDADFHKSELLFYILMLLAIMVSGNLAFIYIIGGTKIAFSLFAILLCAVWLFSIKKAPQNCLLILGVFIVLEIFHYLFAGNPFITCLGMITRIACGFFLVVILREKFLRIYCDIMVKLAVLSFVFYGLILIGAAAFFEPEIKFINSFFVGDSTGQSCVLVHTFFWKHWWRNSGFFWEPGAFSGYLNLALLFLVSLNRKKPFNFFLKSFWILLIAILTTMSTTGYISLVVIILYMLWGRISIRNFIFVFIGMAILFFGAILSFQKLDFLQEKITIQWNNTIDHKHGWQITRIGSLYHDYEYWRDKPLLGWGSNLELRYGSKYDFGDYAGKGNGFADFAVKNGILGIIILLFSIFALGRKLNGESKILALMFSLAVVINLNGEMFLNYPIYLSLIFLGLLPFSEIILESNNNLLE